MSTSYEFVSTREEIITRMLSTAHKRAAEGAPGRSVAEVQNMIDTMQARVADGFTLAHATALADINQQQPRAVRMLNLLEEKNGRKERHDGAVAEDSKSVPTVSVRGSRLQRRFGL